MATVTAVNPAGTRRTSPVLWRAALLLGGLFAAILVLRAGADGWLANEDPMAAAHWAPGKARAATAAARAYVRHGNVANPQISRLVADALDRDATLPSAIELAALDADRAGAHDKAARLFHLSDAISRRSLPTRLWLIQTSVDRGDVAGALQDFDIALRTSTDAPKMLFPVLARASGDPALAAPIAHMLDRPSDWRLTFLRDAVSDYAAAPGIAAVSLRMRDRRWLIANQIDETVIGELIAEDRYAEARVVQDSFHPVAHEDGFVRDPVFTNGGARYPFGWRIEEQGEIGARRTSANGRPALSYQSQSDGSGPVATQLLILPPGRYRLATRTALPAADDTAEPFWTITCAEDGGPQVALLDQPSNGVAATDFVSPPGCSAQWLTLNLRGSDRPDGQSGAIAGVAVMRR